MTQEGQDSVPVYFYEFALENERQHRELGESILRSENRIIRWVAGSAVALAGVIVGMVFLAVRLAE